jgi:hypothetical protein
MATDVREGQFFTERVLSEEGGLKMWAYVQPLIKVLDGKMWAVHLKVWAGNGVLAYLDVDIYLEGSPDRAIFDMVLEACWAGYTGHHYEMPEADLTPELGRRLLMAMHHGARQRIRALQRLLSDATRS